MCLHSVNLSVVSDSGGSLHHDVSASFERYADGCSQ